MLHIEAIKRIKSVSSNDLLKIDISLKTDGITGIFGNSGEGKSTLFNMIAGFVLPETGQIRYKDEIWFSEAQKINVKTYKRNIAYIFQEHNLFPHFTVEQNIAYAIGKSKFEDLNLNSILEALQILKLKDSYPHQLSAGQVKRVALARALAQKAKVILMDEPFSALDIEIRHKMYQFVKKYQQKYQTAILLITHELEDIRQLCEEVVWLQNHEASQVLNKRDFMSGIEDRIRKAISGKE